MTYKHCYHKYPFDNYTKGRQSRGKTTSLNIDRMLTIPHTLSCPFRMSMDAVRIDLKSPRRPNERSRLRDLIYWLEHKIVILLYQNSYQSFFLTQVLSIIHIIENRLKILLFKLSQSKINGVIKKKKLVKGSIFKKNSVTYHTLKPSI